MFEFNDPQVRALAEAVHTEVNSSGVAIWLMKGEDLHIICLIDGLIGREVERILPPKYTIGHMVFDMNKTLVIDDTLSHPLVGKTGAVEDMGIMAYIGTPFHLNGVAIGGISALHQHARRWDGADIKAIEAGAQALSQLALDVSS
ncbi:GAF domain-containing protein [Pacificibacter marinus]|uniref:GAF domain-containing protein n=1 Tax=Pacificibacter marinus TaxID=658057 RepID=UPI001C06D555|nr:GAF domain-containing protein [Pacificibacter marinus]MBU2868437.1 GAF domain-containing protein [Pacificibacter marinus]